MAAEEPRGAVKSATRTLDVLELVAEEGRPLAANEIAAALAIPVSSLSYLLSTLVDRRYLDRRGRRYAIGERLGHLLQREGDLGLAARVEPLVRRLSQELGETASFFVREGDEIEAIATAVSTQALRYTVSVGQRAPLHAFAAGKALLAAGTDADLDAYLAATRREAFTPSTLVGDDELRRAVAAIRRGGTARTQEEHTRGIIGIGRAVGAGKPVGAFSVAIPVARHSPEIDRAAVSLLTNACARLTAQLAP